MTQFYIDNYSLRGDGSITYYINIDYEVAYPDDQDIAKLLGMGYNEYANLLIENGAVKELMGYAFENKYDAARVVKYLNDTHLFVAKLTGRL